MIEILSDWVKNLGLSIVIVSILEMLLPNNKTKKYIRMVIGAYILFCIISPLIRDKDILKEDINEITDSISNQELNTQTVNQTSMDLRIQELYIEELEKDITKKLKEKGYELSKCKVDANISNDEDETKIEKIKIKILKKVELKDENEKVEGQLVTKIQKIKTINTTIQKEETVEETKINKVDIQNVKKFLIEEYGVNEKCLEIN